MGMVPKGPRSAGAESLAKVRNITSGRPRGKPSGLGYDPTTGGEVYSETYRDDSEYEVFGTVRASGYSEERFYTRSVNADGHGERLTVRFPQGIDSQIHAAVSEIPEYRSLQDFFRDAAMHRLEYIQKRHRFSQKAQIMLERERAKADRHERVQDSDEQDAMVKEMETTLAMLHQRGDWSLLAEELIADADTAEFSMRGEYQRQAQEIIRRWRDKSRDQIAKHQEKDQL